MDLWEHEPPAPTEFAGLRIMRVAQNGTTIGTILSDRITGRRTHYAHRRTQPCGGPGCPLCETHGPARWHGWVAIASLKSRYVAVLELTALAAAPLDEYYKRHGSLRGAKLTATRIGNKSNSPVNTKVEPDDVDLRTLPRAPDLQAFLETLWNPNKDRHTATREIAVETARAFPVAPVIPERANGEAKRPETTARRPRRHPPETE